MATTIQQMEMAPTAYPPTPPGAPALNATAVWQRIESYITFRFSPRPVIWTVEGPGEWTPPLAPWTIDNASNISVWSHRVQNWEQYTPDNGPLGFYFRHSGPFQIMATVGAVTTTLPNDIAMAFTRLAFYMAAHGEAGVTSESIAMGDALTHSKRRDANWRAMALQNSGAADLLRQYRRFTVITRDSGGGGGGSSPTYFYLGF